MEVVGRAGPCGEGVHDGRWLRRDTVKEDLGHKGVRTG